MSEIPTDGKKTQRYLDELPETVLQIDEHCGKQFDRYYNYYDEERVLMRTTTGKINLQMILLKIVNILQCLV